MMIWKSRRYYSSSKMRVIVFSTTQIQYQVVILMFCLQQHRHLQNQISSFQALHHWYCFDKTSQIRMTESPLRWSCLSRFLFNNTDPLYRSGPSRIHLLYIGFGFLNISISIYQYLRRMTWMLHSLKKSWVYFFHVSFVKRVKKSWYFLNVCVSSVRRDDANLLCLVPFFPDDHPKVGPTWILVGYI